MIGLLLVAATFARAQAPEPSFEVASVKLLDHRQPAPARIEGDRVIFPYVTLMALITRAYSCRIYEVAGPDWLSEQRYEVLAKIPEDAHADVPAMFRRLLRERFALEAREEFRDEPVYLLLVDRNGPKLKPADVSAEAKSRPPMSISSTGRVVLRGANLDRIAGVLSTTLGEPVLDRTGLDGEYDVELHFNPGEVRGMQLNVDANGAPVQTEATAPGIHGQLKSLGLRLATEKARVRHIVIEHVNKVPTPN